MAGAKNAIIPSTSSRLHDTQIFIGMCITKLPTIADISIIIISGLSAINVALDAPASQLMA